MPNKPSLTSPTLKAAWDRYIGTLEALRVEIETCNQYAEARNQRGIGFRHLMEVQAFAYNFALAPRTAHPRVIHNTCWQPDYYMIGGPGGDFDYRMIMVDARHTYRLTGKINDSRMIWLQVNSAGPGQPGARMVANYDVHKFKLGKDKSFEAIISVKKHEGNWIELVPDGDYQWLMMRPTAETWNEVPAEFAIERISELPSGTLGDEYSEEALARRIDVATSFTNFVIREWVLKYVPQIEQKAGARNKFMTLTVPADDSGSLAAHYQHCVYEVEDDEALILEFEREPEGAYWSLQLYDIWHRALPFRTNQAMLNWRQLAKDADGAIRVVVSRQDPGMVNWLDNQGVAVGEVAWRIYEMTKNTSCKFHRIKFVDLQRHLPPATKKVTPQERTAELQRRAAAYQKRYHE